MSCWNYYKQKTGNAVERNRSRRIIRAACQSVFRDYELSGNFDIVFVSRNKTKYLKSPQVEKAMIECMKDVGVIK